MAFCRRRYTFWSSLSSAALVFVLFVLQSVHSYDFSDAEDYFDILTDAADKVGDENDTEFPGRILNISRVKRRLDQYDREMLLFEHNTHRRTTDPLASDMVFMVWSLNLQREARKVAENCNETYELSEEGRSSMQQWFSTAGINTWMESGRLALFKPPEDVTDRFFRRYLQGPAEMAKFKFVVGNVVHKWTEEKTFYSYTMNTCRLGKLCDQYIQVIWSTASHVGCELHFCDNFVTTSKMTRYNLYYLVCVYGEGLIRRDDDGKYVKPFTNGTQCQNCPTGFSGCSDGLCQTIPPCETVVDCTVITDLKYCLCDPSTYDHSHRLTTSHWTWMGVWLTGAILSSFLAS